MFPSRKRSKNSQIKDVEESYPSSSTENLSKDGKDGGDSRYKKMYEVFFLGIVPDIMMNSSLTRDKEAQLVDRIEEAQIDGKMPVSSQDDDRVKIAVSIHGVKVLDMKGQEVLQRHPLQTVAQVVQYSDGGDVNYLAFKIGNVNKQRFSAYVFQCISSEQAQNICQIVRVMFDLITDKNR